MIDKLAKLPLVYQPGTEWQYSMSGSSSLAAIRTLHGGFSFLESSGKSLPAVARAIRSSNTMDLQQSGLPVKKVILPGPSVRLQPFQFGHDDRSGTLGNQPHATI